MDRSIFGRLSSTLCPLCVSYTLARLIYGIRSTAVCPVEALCATRTGARGGGGALGPVNEDEIHFILRIPGRHLMDVSQ